MLLTLKSQYCMPIGKISTFYNTTLRVDQAITNYSSGLDTMMLSILKISYRQFKENRRCPTSNKILRANIKKWFDRRIKAKYRIEMILMSIQYILSIQA